MQNKQSSSRPKREPPVPHLGGVLSRRIMMVPNPNKQSDSHDAWNQVASAVDSLGSPQKGKHGQSTDRGKQVSSSELERRARARRQKLGGKKGDKAVAGAPAAEGADKATVKKRSAVGAVETGLIYALTCPLGKKYVGKTMRTLTNRVNEKPTIGAELIRAAIKSQAMGIGAFKTEVIMCCALPALDANEQLYIKTLGTLHPKGYNMAPQTKKDGKDAGDGDDDGEEDDPIEEGPPCAASKNDGKLWLDAAMGGRVDELMAMHAQEASLIHYRGQGLGQTALHWACAKGHAEAVRWLVEKGSDVEARNQNRARPLHAAAASGSLEVVEHIISRGARVDLVDGDGRNCEQIARERGHTELAAMLHDKHWAVTDARDRAMSAAEAAAYAKAAAARCDIIPIVTPVEDVIAQGLVGLAIAGDIVARIDESPPEDDVRSRRASRESKESTGEAKEGGGGSSPGGSGEAASNQEEAYNRKNKELEAQLGDVERKLRLDKLYASQPNRDARIYY